MAEAASRRGFRTRVSPKPNHRLKLTARGRPGASASSRSHAAAYGGRYATLRLRRLDLTVSRTRAPSRVSMSMSASVLNRSMRPRRRSLTRGCDTRSSLTAACCFSRRDAMIFWTSIIRSARTRRCSASSRRNPRSRNTLPVEGVILSFLGNLASRQAAHAALSDQGTVPLPDRLQVAARRFPRALLERVQHIDSRRELGGVQYSMLEGCVNADFADAGTDARNGLPVQGIQALFDTPKLKACELSGGRCGVKSAGTCARRG